MNLLYQRGFKFQYFSFLSYLIFLDIYQQTAENYAQVCLLLFLHVSYSLPDYQRVFTLHSMLAPNEAWGNPSYKASSLVRDVFDRRSLMGIPLQR